MAKPRVFISSTYYDLKHIRASLDLFVEGLGYEPVLSEKGDIAYSPDQPLDRSCYREAGNADVFVLIIGGRYGSEISFEKGKGAREKQSFFDRYESITKKEYMAAIERDIPVYIMIEAGVFSEYQTYRQNRANESIKYAHVDSINVFSLIDEILHKPKNNPIKTFERASDIEIWLRDQWAGLFREMISNRSEQEQLRALTQEVDQMREMNNTFKTYLEMVIRSISPDRSDEVIQSEEKRLSEAQRLSELKKNDFVVFISGQFGLETEHIAESLREANSLRDLIRIISSKVDGDEITDTLRELLYEFEAALADLNSARKILGLEEFDEKERKTLNH